MKKLFFLIFSLFLFKYISAQENETVKKVEEIEAASQSYNDVFTTLENKSQIGALANLTQIEDETYVGIRLRPELKYKKFGLGLDIPVLVNVNNNTVRTEEFNNGVGPLRVVRYARYGIKKRDPVYVRLGDISGTYLGYGALVNNYSNSASFERRKVGLSWDILVKKKFGLEGFYSDLDFASPNLFGIRPYIRPLVDFDIPIIRSTELGFTYVQDRDNTKSQFDDDGIATRSDLLNNSVRAWGVDIGWDVLKTKIVKVKTFVQYAKLAENNAINDQAEMDFLSYGAGDGFSVGALASFGIAGEFLQLNTRLERLWYSDNYLPQFFDAIYEINKDDKLTSLISAKKRGGTFGSLTGVFVSKIRIGGALLIPDKVSDSSPAYLRLDASLTDLFEKLSFTASYMKGDITNLADSFRIDERSLANARVAYRVSEIFVAGIDYRWTFSRRKNGDIETTNYVMPYFGLNVPLNLEGKQP